MQIKGLKKYLIFPFLLSIIWLISLQVIAASPSIQKEKVLHVKNKKEQIEEGEKAFPETRKEDGKAWKRSGIDYEVLSIKYLYQKEKKIEVMEEPKETMQEGEYLYRLKMVEKKERIRNEKKTQTVVSYDDYDVFVTSEDVPKTKVVTEKNQETGKEEQVTCSFAGIQNLGVSMRQNIMSMTFSDYDAAFYEWNGYYLPRNTETPPIAGYEEELLSSTQAVDGSRIVSYEWSGDPYQVDGVWYRDASAVVEQPVTLYRVNYQGTITIPEETETVYHAVYEAEDVNREKEMEIRVIATYEEVSGISVLQQVLVCVGLVLLIGLIVAILMLLKKKKKLETNY